MRVRAVAMTIGFLVGNVAFAHADLEPKFCSPQMQTQVFTSASAHVRVVVPRTWCGSESASYPGLLLWMQRTQPPGQIALTSEAFTRELYCGWPVECRQESSNSARYACALRKRLANLGMRVGPVQLGPKDIPGIDDAGGASKLAWVWFEYDDNRRFLRHAIAVTDDRALTLVLTTGSNDARAGHARAFEQALRSVELLGAKPLAPGGQGSAAPAPSTPARQPAIGTCAAR